MLSLRMKNQKILLQNNPLLCIKKKSMRMNNDYICSYDVDYVDGMIDDGHTPRLMWKYVDNQYNKKLQILMMDEILIDVR